MIWQKAKVSSSTQFSLTCFILKISKNLFHLNVENPVSKVEFSLSLFLTLSLSPTSTDIGDVRAIICSSLWQCLICVWPY